MLEFQHNEDLDAAALAEFFIRMGWQEAEGTSKVEWAIASSDDWIVCRLEGELVGFGRTVSLDPRRKVMFDVVVDERFQGLGLTEEIMRRLADTLPAAQFQLFSRADEGYMPGVVSWAEVGHDVPEVTPDTYTGR